MERNQREELIRASRQATLPPHDVHRRVVEEGVHLDALEPRARKQRKLADEVVEPLARRTQQEQSPRLESQCRLERQLEIRRILVGRMPLGAQTGWIGLDRVEVADDEGRRQSRCPCMIGARVCSDDRGTRRYRPDGRRTERAATRDDDDGVDGHAASQPHAGAAPERAPPRWIY